MAEIRQLRRGREPVSRLLPSTRTHARRGRGRRLPERRQVDADQPADGQPADRRPRDAGGHPRPQRGRLRVGAGRVPPGRHRRRRCRRRLADAGRRSPSRPGRRWRRPTWCSWSSMREPASPQETRRSPRSCAGPAGRLSWWPTRSTISAHEEAALELHALGLGDPVPVSVAARPRHRGSARRGGRAGCTRSAPSGSWRTGTRSGVAILGRPERRQVVAAERDPGPAAGDRRRRARHHPRPDRHRAHRAGTTRFRLIDTAGLRRKRAPPPGDRVLQRAAGAPGRRAGRHRAGSVDSSEGVAEGDLSVADEARKAGCATLVVLVKWDISLTTVEDASDRLQRQTPPAARDRHHLGAHRAQRRPPAGRGRASSSSATRRASAPAC